MISRRNAYRLYVGRVRVSRPLETGVDPDEVAVLQDRPGTQHVVSLITGA